MPLSDHRFALTIPLAAATPAVVSAALHEMAPSWRVDAVPACRRGAMLIAPVLQYGELARVQDVIRAVRRAGAHVEDAGSIELRIDAARFDARALRTLRSLLDKQAQLLAQVLGRPVEQLGFEHGKVAPFPKGGLTIALRPRLNSGELGAAIVLVLAIVDRALSARAASSKPRPFDETSARYDFRCFLLRLGLIGEEYRDVREQLLRRLPGSAAWKRGRPPVRLAVSGV